MKLYETCAEVNEEYIQMCLTNCQKLNALIRSRPFNSSLNINNIRRLNILLHFFLFCNVSIFN